MMKGLLIMLVAVLLATAPGYSWGQQSSEKDLFPKDETVKQFKFPENQSQEQFKVPENQAVEKGKFPEGQPQQVVKFPENQADKD